MAPPDPGYSRERLAPGVTRSSMPRSSDEGDPHELAAEYASLVARFPNLTILGECCGTDERHIEQIASACITSAWPRAAER
jgi:methionine synthase I (cobalamin-dependent)